MTDKPNQKIQNAAIPYFVFTSGETGQDPADVNTDWGVKFTSLGHKEESPTRKKYQEIMESFGMDIKFETKDGTGKQNESVNLLLLPWDEQTLIGFVFPYKDSTSGGRPNRSLVAALVPEKIRGQFSDVRELIKILWRGNELQDIAKREPDRVLLKKRPRYLSLNEHAVPPVAGDADTNEHETRTDLFIPETLSWPDPLHASLVMNKTFKEYLRQPYWIFEAGKNGEREIRSVFVSPAMSLGGWEEKFNSFNLKSHLRKIKKDTSSFFVLPWKKDEAFLGFVYPRFGRMFQKSFSVVGVIVQRKHKSSLIGQIQGLWDGNLLEQYSHEEQVSGKEFLSFGAQGGGRSTLYLPADLPWPSNDKGILVFDGTCIDLYPKTHEKYKKPRSGKKLIALVALFSVFACITWTWPDFLKSIPFIGESLHKFFDISSKHTASDDRPQTPVKDRKEELRERAKAMFIELEHIRNNDPGIRAALPGNSPGLSGLRWIAFFSDFDSAGNVLTGFSFAERGSFPFREKERIVLRYPETDYFNKAVFQSEIEAHLNALAPGQIGYRGEYFTLDGIGQEQFKIFKAGLAASLNAAKSGYSSAVDAESLLSAFETLLIELDNKKLSFDNGYFAFAFKMDEGLYDFWMMEARKDGQRLGGVEHRHYLSSWSETSMIDFQKAAKLIKEKLYDKSKKPYIADMPLGTTLDLHFVFSAPPEGTSKERLLSDFARQLAEWVLKESRKEM